jgi:hypothetical protein
MTAKDGKYVIVTLVLGVGLFSLRGGGSRLIKKRRESGKNRWILIYIYFVASFQAIKRSKGKKIRTISITTTTK